MSKKIRFITLILLLLTLIICLVSCGSNSKDRNATDEYYSEAPGLSGSQEDAKESVNNVSEAKIIKNATVYAETKNYAEATDKLKALIERFGGNIASSSASESASYYSDGKIERQANYTIKIPSENFDSFLDELDGFLNITNLSTSTEDVTETYFTLESRISTLESKRAGLISMLENVDVNTDFDTWQKINAELTEIDVQLNYYNEQLKNLDKRVTKSTVTLTLREVVEYTDTEEKGYGSEVAEAFKESFSNVGKIFKWLFIALIHILPFALISGAVTALVFAIIKICKRKKK